ncbi:MAG: APH(3') family aminoglycoside O-phosphotransferase [Pyrinomonadaceae bacterium]
MNTEAARRFLPPALAEAVNGYHWQQILTGCSTSQVFRLKKADRERLYLKVDARSFTRPLKQEHLRLLWLRERLPVPQTLMFAEAEDSDYLLLSEVAGVDASDKSCQANAAQVIEQLAAGLKMIHSVPVDRCPFDMTLSRKVELAREMMLRGLVDESDFDESRRGRTAQELYDELIECVPAEEELVFTHGDYCLPNIILRDLLLSGFVDWGQAGIADRYQDIALAARSVESNYGREWVSALFEACAITPDSAKLHFYTLLDEFF